MSFKKKFVLLHTNTNGDQTPYPFISSLPEVLLQADPEGLLEAAGVEDYHQGDKLSLIPLGVNAFTWPDIEYAPGGENIIRGERWMVVPIIADPSKETPSTLLASL